MSSLLRRPGFSALAVLTLLGTASAFFVFTKRHGSLHAAPLPETPAQKKYRAGLESLAKGSLNGAEAAFKLSLRLDSDQVAPLLGLSEVALKRGDLQETEKYLEQALRIDPKSADVQTSWGRYLLLRHKFPEAEKAFKTASKLNPKAVQPLTDLGDLYLTVLHNPKEAIPTYQAVLAREPNHAGARYALGVALATVGQLDKAKVQFGKAAKLAPTNPLPWQSLGKLYVTRKEYDKAVKAYAMALRAQPKFILARLARGDVSMERGQWDQALGEYRKALRIDPLSAEAKLKIGMVLERQGQLDEAAQAYLETLQLDPKQAVAYNNLAWIAVGRKAQLDEAILWAKRAVELAPHIWQFHDTLGKVQQARGELKEAEATLKYASTLSAQSPN